MSGVGFKLITLVFRIRDILRPRMDLLKEAGIEVGFCILDYGCGPGSYIVPLTKLVGTSGKIYALDIHPLAIKEVQKIAARKAISNKKQLSLIATPDSILTRVTNTGLFNLLSKGKKTYSFSKVG